MADLYAYGSVDPGSTSFDPSHIIPPGPDLSSRCQEEAAMWKNIEECIAQGYDHKSAVIKERVDNAVQSGRSTSASILPIIQSWSSSSIGIPYNGTLTSFGSALGSEEHRLDSIVGRLRLNAQGKSNIIRAYQWALTDGLMTAEQVAEDIQDLRRTASGRYRFETNMAELLRSSARRCGSGLERPGWQNSMDELRTLLKTYLALSLPRQATDLQAFGYFERD